MVWKRLVPMFALVLVLLLPMTLVAGSDESEVNTCQNKPDKELLPYGSKVEDQTYLSTGLHDFKLAYWIFKPTVGSSFLVMAVNPVIDDVPDFDVRAVGPNDETIYEWNNDGNEVGTIPEGTEHLFIYMPVGPDAHIGGNVANAATGTFSYYCLG